MICPKCKSDYVEGIKTCPDCQVELIEESDLEEKDELFWVSQRLRASGREKENKKEA